jgi:UDP-N-acetylglucosamine 2-epimerase (non-hydrolysing)
VPAVTIRDVTERPETLECGSNVLSGADPQRMADCVRMVVERPRDWRVPPEYLAERVSETVLGLLFGHPPVPRGLPC